MHLRSLTLKGFKSFAEPATIDLLGGVNVVVGPNGSGKSNIVDSLAWVLGAQGPSVVRSGKMDDVIFAGTTERPALGRAEVTLVLDNADGQLPVELTEVMIRRTLFRNGESEYALNGVPCRLLDITELLSDSGIGRTQHVIVSQGQLDDVLKARSTERRMIIEEAAGVLKFRKRKEKAERRLTSTEANLTRLADLVREVRRQLRPLERQADAARRHGDLVAELNALRLHLAGREIEAGRAKLSAFESERAIIATDDKGVRERLAELDTDVLAAEAQLGSLGADDTGDDLVSGESLREKALGLVALLAERRRGLLKDRSSLLSRDVVASMEAEAARLEAELADVELAALALAPDIEVLGAARAHLGELRERFAADHGDAEVRPAGRAAEVRGRLGALRTGIETTERDAEQRRRRLSELETRIGELTGEAERHRAALAEAEAAESAVSDALDIANQHVRDAEARAAAAGDRRRAQSADQERWTARTEALEMALIDARTAAGASRLEDLAGVLGTLADLVAVDEGYEVALEAALGEAVRAVVVSDRDVARRALHHLASGEWAGAVLALGVGAPPAPTLPRAGEHLRHHVTSSRPDVGSLLDALLGGCVVVDGGWTAACDLALAHPDLVIVTPQGDRFGPSGWRVGSGGSGATGAALVEARHRLDQTEAELALATAAEVEAAESVRLAIAQRDAAEQALDQHDERRNAVAEALGEVESERRGRATEAGALHSHLDEIAHRLRGERAVADQLAAELEVLEGEEEAASEAAAARRRAHDHIEEQARQVGVASAEVEVRRAGIDDRRGFLQQRHAEVAERLDAHREEAEAAGDRRQRIDHQLGVVDRLVAMVNDRLATVEGHLEGLRERRRHHSDAVRAVADRLDTLRRDRATTERSLEELRERERRIELDGAEARVRLENLIEALRGDLDVEPEVAIAALCPELDDGVTPRARVRELERELKIMGPINPLALQEFDELTERHEFLDSQLDDVKATRRDLNKIIRKVDGEIVEVFAAAFADVADNFETLFQTLFPGGRGRIRLTEPDNLLESGVEIEAKPAGKNVKQLSLLSGGERSLTAMAYLFAVFRSRPSPFYVLDEVEAALDDVNLSRFLDLIDEFRREAQLVIVSHQKRTMEAADQLYGVTMAAGGSTKIVTEKLSG
ncbi:MAG TPA: chromosome segregation protein SMC [Acidimicrobiales bacterium]